MLDITGRLKLKVMSSDNSHRIMLIAHFVSSAKKAIGHIHAAELLTNQAYATEHILKAIFSDDQALVEQAKDLCPELNLNINLIRGMEEYLEACKMNQSAPDYTKTRDYLIKLSSFVYSLNADGDAYRLAADAFLSTLDTGNKPFGLNLIRELYFFWNIEENPSPIEKFDSVYNYLFKLQPTNKFLIEKWNDVDNVKLSNIEHDKLQLYVQALIDLALNFEAVRTRKKFAKIIVLELRDQADKSQKSYRAVINKVKTAIQKDDLRSFFIQVSREFYHFWMEEQEAEQHIKLE